VPDALRDANERVHAALDELLLSAIDALTELDLGRARSRWTALQAALAQHAATEEALVLPVYARAEAFARGGALELFEAEHRKLEQLAADGLAAIDALGALSATALRRRCVLALDGLLRVRHLLEHHGLREKTHLYPAVAALYSAAERDAALGALAANVEAAGGQHG
jgi:hypothetical protein